MLEVTTVKVLKFGGTSMGDGARIQSVADILLERAEGACIGVVVSAVGGVTNRLLASVDAVLASARERTPSLWGGSGGHLAAEVVGRAAETFYGIHEAILKDLEVREAGLSLDGPRRQLEALTREYRDLLHGVYLLRECPPSVSDLLACMGEQASVAVLAGLLRGRGVRVTLIDPLDYILTNGVFGGSEPRLAETYARFAPLKGVDTDVLLMPGFYGAGPGGQTTTLGRGGTDFSAAIMAGGLDAEALEIWTDVEGIFSADPRIVPEAFALAEASFEEAMELSFFGAKVLHPRTVAPVYVKGIPTWVKNTFDPKAPGTKVHAAAPAPDRPVRGLSLLGEVAMLTISGPAMQGSRGTAARVFDAMARAGISVILITQASSEYSIGFCVREGEADAAKAALEAAFELELAVGQLSPLHRVPNLSILSIVGDGMKERPGTAGTFLSALAEVDVNIVAIAQGSSERSISCVIGAPDARRAIRKTHQRFFETRQTIQAFIMGTGLVGGALLDQIQRQQAALFAQGVDLRVCGIANSRRMLLDVEGLSLEAWRGDLAAAETPASLDALCAAVRGERPVNPILVDCTASEALAEGYLKAFDAGLHIATPNKKANTLSLGYYHRLRSGADRHKRRFLYETTVGAGLPIIDTLKNLVKSGDRILAFEGIFSGSLSFIFGRLDEGVAFSEALGEARERGLTEPDPREDLGGMDVARKLLILAREAGYALEMGDIEVEGALPEGAGDPAQSTADFIASAPGLDAHFAQRLQALKAEGKVLRFVGRMEAGRCVVGLVAVGPENPLFHVRGGENAVSFRTGLYSPVPLVVRGYGAGPEVTAAGVFADVLRTVFWNRGVSHPDLLGEDA